MSLFKPFIINIFSSQLVVGVFEDTYAAATGLETPKKNNGKISQNDIIGLHQ